MEEQKANSARTYILQRIIPEPNTGCWLWIMRSELRGYPLAGFSGKTVRVSRLSYEAFIGEIPKGMTIDHKCGVKCCLNPAHLDAVSDEENRRRAGVPSYINSQKNECIHGHPLFGDNVTPRSDGKRRCVTCQSLRDRGRKR